MQTTEAFKVCPKCSKNWSTLNDFLNDDALILNGYQANLKNLESGLLLFTHMVEGCKTTMGLYVSGFSHLYNGVRYPENKALSAECPRFCIDEKRLDRCDVFCECAYAREIVNIVKNMRTGG